MTEAVDRALTVSLARAAVSALAPEELPIFDPVSERFARDPDRALDPVRTKDDMLGFGIDLAVPLLTPVAVAVAAEALRYVALHLSKTLRGRKQGETSPSSPRLTADQLRELHEVAYGKALAARLNETRATALADAVVAALAMTSD